MAKRIKHALAPPLCMACGMPAELATGAEAIPHRSDLAKEPYWHCAPCGAWCACKKGTSKPVGQPAPENVRRARQMLRDRVLDPIWREEPFTLIGYEAHDGKARAMVQNAARRRTYEYLAERMGIEVQAIAEDTLDLEQCREAWAILQDTNALEIRILAKQKEGDTNGQSKQAASG